MCSLAFSLCTCKFIDAANAPSCVLHWTCLQIHACGMDNEPIMMQIIRYVTATCWLILVSVKCSNIFRKNIFTFVLHWFWLSWPNNPNKRSSVFYRPLTNALTAATSMSLCEMAMSNSHLPKSVSVSNVVLHLNVWNVICALLQREAFYLCVDLYKAFIAYVPLCANFKYTTIFLV